MKILPVEFPRFIPAQYEIWFSDEVDVWMPLLQKNIQASSWWVLTDSRVAEYVYPVIQDKLPPHTLIVVPEGEQNKNLDTCRQVWSELSLAGADRNAVLISLGGGMITDLGGFAASCWKRGIRFIHIPTSLLAMVDASIGGKTGIDFQSGKNLLGLFSIPSLVIIDPVWLKTLNLRELRAGFAECLKHGLIADEAYWLRLSQTSLEEQEWEFVIYRSLMLKSEIVKNDPDEQWMRKNLNFGHTVGHALESLCLEKGISFLHGEAVALGMMIESALSTKFAGLPYAEFQKISATIRSMEFPVPPLRMDEDETIHKFIFFLGNDKKNVGKDLRMSLISQPGKGVFDVPVPIEEVILATRALFSQLNG